MPSTTPPVTGARAPGSTARSACCLPCLRQPGVGRKAGYAALGTSSQQRAALPLSSEGHVRGSPVKKGRKPRTHLSRDTGAGSLFSLIAGTQSSSGWPGPKRLQAMDRGTGRASRECHAEGLDIMLRAGDSLQVLWETQMFAAVRWWEPPECPSTDARISRESCVLTVGCYLATERNEVLTHAARGMNSADRMLSEGSLSQGTDIVGFHR